jgi:DNA-directed RNA polymerase sigma subunit (sigma70/sigma32)
MRQTQREIEEENQTRPGYAQKNLDHWFNPAEQIISLDQPIDGSEGTLGVDLVASEAPDPEETVIERESARDIRRWLALLPDLPKMVLMRRYGLDGREPETLAAIGTRLGATRERVRQIQVEGLNHLRRLVETGVIPVDAISFAR